MGLTEPSGKSLVGPDGRPLARPADPFFLEVNDELADKGFLVT